MIAFGKVSFHGIPGALKNFEGLGLQPLAGARRARRHGGLSLTTTAPRFPRFSKTARPIAENRNLQVHATTDGPRRRVTQITGLRLQQDMAETGPQKRLQPGTLGPPLRPLLSYILRRARPSNNRKRQVKARAWRAHES